MESEGDVFDEATFYDVNINFSRGENSVPFNKTKKKKKKKKKKIFFFVCMYLLSLYVCPCFLKRPK